MKKRIVIICIIGILLALIINYRTPFVTSKGGKWSIGYGFSNSNLNSKLLIKNATIYSFDKLKKYSDSTSFLADPFFIKEKDTFYIFFEHKKEWLNNAVVSLLTSTDGINYTYKGVVLKEKFHLSYPQVFKYNEEFYMIPETKRANAVLLYKAFNFPYNWKIVDTLIKNVRLKDPSIYLSDSLNILVASDDNMNMFMYKSKSLFSNWKLHEKKKVIIGTEARAGGRFFINDNKLHLPIQNCTKGYGSGLSIYKFDFKNGDYTIKKVQPLFFKGIDSIKELSFGMHHLDIQLLDGNFYYVFDGNIKLDEKALNIRGPLKWNFIDLKNWINKKFN